MSYFRRNDSLPLSAMRKTASDAGTRRAVGFRHGILIGRHQQR